MYAKVCWKKLWAYLTQESGVAAVEFALITPILLLLIMGVIDYGRFINNRMQLQELSRSAAEYLVQGGDTTSALDSVIETSEFYAASQSAGLPFTTTIEQICTCEDGVETVCSGTCVGGGDYLRYFYDVQIDATYSAMFIYPGVPETISVQGHTRLRYD